MIDRVLEGFGSFDMQRTRDLFVVTRSRFIISDGCVLTRQEEIGAFGESDKPVRTLYDELQVAVVLVSGNGAASNIDVVAVCQLDAMYRVGARYDSVDDRLHILRACGFEGHQTQIRPDKYSE